MQIQLLLSCQATFLHCYIDLLYRGESALVIDQAFLLDLNSLDGILIPSAGLFRVVSTTHARMSI